MFTSCPCGFLWCLPETSRCECLCLNLCVHGALRWTDIPSWVFSHHALSVAKICFRSSAALTRMKWLLRGINVIKCTVSSESQIFIKSVVVTGICTDLTYLSQSNSSSVGVLIRFGGPFNVVIIYSFFMMVAFQILVSGRRVWSAFEISTMVSTSLTSLQKSTA